MLSTNVWHTYQRNADLTMATHEPLVPFDVFHAVIFQRDTHSYQMRMYAESLEEESAQLRLEGDQLRVIVDAQKGLIQRLENDQSVVGNINFEFQSPSNTRVAQGTLATETYSTDALMESANASANKGGAQGR